MQFFFNFKGLYYLGLLIGKFPFLEQIRLKIRISYSFFNLLLFLYFVPVVVVVGGGGGFKCLKFVISGRKLVCWLASCGIKG